MYPALRILRILVSVMVMLITGTGILWLHDGIFARMQLIPAILSGAAVWIAVWAVVTLIFGRIYCSTVCPLGTLQDCVSALRRFSHPGWRYSYAPPMPRLRLTFMLTALVLMVTGWGVLPTVMDPYSSYARIVGGLLGPLESHIPGLGFTWASFGIGAGIALIVVALSFRGGRTLCNTICPVGSLLGMGAQRALMHTEINPDKCIDCGRCVDLCKGRCIDLPARLVDNSRCVVCFDCMAVCPNDAITYRIGRHRLGMPQMQLSSTSDNMQKNDTCNNTSHS